MYIARILYPVRVLGPGNRIGIWFAGCVHHCPGCSNPELWEQAPRYRTELSTVMRLIHMICDNRRVDGFTITGGDPFYQPEALGELLGELKKLASDILVYTGYLYEEIREAYPEQLRNVSVLIDGKYVEAENHGSPLKGSDNQRMLILEEGARERYEAYLTGRKNVIQNFSTEDGIISVGIHRPGYEGELLKISPGKGLEEKK